MAGCPAGTIISPFSDKWMSVLQNMPNTESITPFRDDGCDAMVTPANRRFRLPVKKRHKLRVLFAMWRPAGWRGSHLRATIPYRAVGSIARIAVAEPEVIISQVGTAA
jgi:hypothetical protein